MAPRRKQEPPTPVIDDPLAVIPMVAPDVDIRETDGGEFHLRKTYPPEGWFRRFLHHRVGWRKERFCNLDKRGTEFWKLIDGRRPLSDIVTMLEKEWDVGREEAIKASMVYLQALMLRNLVVLEVPRGRTRKGTA